ncbi:hypothetical protein QBC41DRAFT_221919, partial [Cercophora samala]
SRLTGNTANILKPYLYKDYPDRLITYKALIIYLYNKYNDPNRVEDAKKEFQKLTYKLNDSFAIFKNNFVRLASKIRKLKLK